MQTRNSMLCGAACPALPLALTIAAPSAPAAAETAIWRGRGSDLHMASISPPQLLVIEEGQMNDAQFAVYGSESGFQTYQGACEAAQ